MNFLRFGYRQDGITRNELIVKVFQSDFESSFTLYEYNGSTVEIYDARRDRIIRCVKP